MPKQKYYAVKVGRDSPAIYLTWDECKQKTTRYPNALYKSFVSRTQAQAWLSDGSDDVDMVDVAQARNATSITPAPIVHPSSSSTLSTSITPPESTATTSSSDMPHPVVPTELALSHEQQQVLNLVKDGKNVFFTGSAGTGKSHLLRAIIDYLRSTHSSGFACAVTATTGIASVNIGGVTLHSWAGIGLGKEDEKKLAGKIAANKAMDKVRQRWRRVLTLIIDEISMLDGVLFDKLEFVARYLRRSDQPFGGIQLVISGDFTQLPPVPERDSKNGMSSVVFAFQAKSWNACMDRPVLLKKVFRQKDSTFIDMLNAMRFGQVDAAMTQKFLALSRRVEYDDGVEPSELYPTRGEVAGANNRRLNALPGKPETYRAADGPGLDEDRKPISMDRAERLLERLVVPKEITLKIGAQVMLIKNMRQGELVNGSLGVVIAFSTSRELYGQQNSAGPTLNPGQPSIRDLGYVENLNDNPDNPRPPRIDDSGQPWPIVRFLDGRKMFCPPTDFTVLNGAGEVEARRDQVPLILAWALSVHKSQGQTLQRVKVDLGRTFEKGQAYVALSRAVTMDQLQVINFNPAKVMAHEAVVRWYKQLMGEVEMEEVWDEFDDEDLYAALDGY